jgi:hypothetical protein
MRPWDVPLQIIVEHNYILHDMTKSVFRLEIKGNFGWLVKLAINSAGHRLNYQFAHFASKISCIQILTYQ